MLGADPGGTKKIQPEEFARTGDATLKSGRKYLTHRLAWLYRYGEWPPEQVDHINGAPDDNRIINLRLATPSQNAMNMRKWKNNGLPKGVHASKGGYKATIWVAGRNRHLGCFATPEAAHRTYAAFACEAFGEYARTA